MIGFPGGREVTPGGYRSAVARLIAEFSRRRSDRLAATAHLGVRSGVRTRLVLIAIIPLAALVALSAPVVATAHSQMDTTRAAQAAVRAAGQSMQLDADVAAEESYSLAEVTLARSPGPASNSSAQLVGVITKKLTSAQQATDMALSSMPLSEAQKVSAPLYTQRAQLADGSATLGGEIRLSGEAFAAAESWASQLLLNAGDLILSVPAEQRTALSLLASVDVLGAVETSTGQLRMLSEAWSSSVAQRPAAVLALARSQGEFDLAGQSLANSGVAALEANWKAFTASSSYSVFGDLVTRVSSLAQPGGPASGGSSLSAASFAAGLSSTGGYWSTLQGLSAKAAVSSLDAISALSAAAAFRFWLWLSVVALAVVLALGGAVTVARGISNPLERLAGAALAVVRGSLEVEYLAPVGPRETVLVADAFNSLMSNLRLLEAKSEALSRCDLDNELLDSPLPGRIGAALQGSFRALADSVRERTELQERLAFEATHDALTGLTNRSALVDHLERLLERAGEHPRAVAVFYMDLDNFKRANDLHGHRCGDHVLRQVGRRLISTTRSHDLVARIGGDEFVVVADGISSLREAEYLALRFVACLSEPVKWEALNLEVGTCVGIALSAGAGVGALDLLARADLALYQAKQRGGSSIGVFDEQVQQRLAISDGVERDLRDELAGDASGLTLFYQPLVSTHMELCGLEALIRWQRADHGPMSPGEFIPLAEASDLIVDLDNWVLRAVMRQMRQWDDHPVLGSLNVAVNISGRHLRGKRLISDLRSAVDATGVTPNRITLEITETVILNDLESVASQLREVHDLGFGVAVDDFGTGYTSLAHLRHLPVDTIKIDRSFVSGVTDSDAACLVRLISDLARSLDMTTVSEGVETPEQLEALREIGTDALQGFLIARPMPPALLHFWCEGRMVAPARPRRRS